MRDLLQNIETNILSRNLIKRGKSIVVGVSGGLDSMVLLHVLHKLSAKHGWKIAIAHFNHKLRGRSSEADEKFVRKAASDLKVPIFVESADVKSFAQKEKLSIEMAARTLRHEFFVRAAAQNKSAKIALAHHAEDQVELFFMRLLRGSGSEGLGGMYWASLSPVNPKLKIVRPFLDQTKETLKEFVTKNKIRFREDASNASVDFQRNRIRHQLLPFLKKYQPAYAQTVLRSMDIITWESNFVLGAALDWLSDKKPEPFEKLHLAVQRVCLRLQMRHHGFLSDFDLIEQLRKNPDEKIELAPATYIFRDKNGKVHVAKNESTTFKSEEMAVDLAKATKIQFGRLNVSWKIQKKPGASFTQKPQNEHFDATKVGNRILLRHWREGDRFQPIGMKTGVKLQDLFVNLKVPRAERTRKVVALAENGEIFWVQGLRISERFKLDKTTTHRLNWIWKQM